MKNRFLLLFVLPLFHTAQATVCSWSGPAMGNWSEPANWSCGLVPGANDTVQLTGHSVMLNDSVAIRALILAQNCTIAGTGTLVILGKMEAKNGGNHTFLTQIMVQGQLETNMATLNFNARPFVLAGTAHFTKGIFWMKDGGVFDIAPTGVATFQDQTNFYSFTSYFGFVVRGTMIKTGASNMDFESLYLFKKANIHIQSGYLVNYYAQSPVNCVIDSSTVNIAAGAFLRVERSLDISNSTLTGAGKIWIGIGNLRFLHPNNILAEVEQRGGGCSGINGVDTLANYSLLGGMISNGLQIGGQFNWVKGNTGNLLVEGFTTISDTTITSVNQKNIAGTLSVQGGGKYTGNDQVSGTIRIPAGAVFSLDANPAANVKADFQIFGTLQKLNTGSAAIGFVVNNGRIEGTGTLEGMFFGPGTVAPGLTSAAGTLTMSGPNLFLQADSKVEIQVASTGAVDLLNLTGACKLAGILTLLESGNAPAGDYVVVQATGGLTGSFAAANLPPGWELVQNPLNITLRKLPTPPNAQFTVQTPSPCAGAQVQFVDASTGDALSYAWDFPGGSPATSTEQNPLVTYAQAGQFTATLTLSNALGTSTFSQEFTVYSTDYTVQQTDTSLIVNAIDATFQWLDCSDFSPVQGATEAVFTPVSSGSYAVQVTQNGCTDISDCYTWLQTGTEIISAMPPHIQVSPNPGAGFVQLRWSAATGVPDAVYVFDQRGTLLVWRAGLQWEQQVAALDLRYLGAGAYFLVLERGGRWVGGVWVLVE